MRYALEECDERTRQRASAGSAGRQPTSTRLRLASSINRGREPSRTWRIPKRAVWPNWAKIFNNNKGVAAKQTDNCSRYPPDDQSRVGLVARPMTNHL
jgi:hypothetical protein